MILNGPCVGRLGSLFVACLFLGNIRKGYKKRRRIFSSIYYLKCRYEFIHSFIHDLFGGEFLVLISFPLNRIEYLFFSPPPSPLDSNFNVNFH
ncbi:hypothetical protein BLA29_009815 [Euroglyphus maynei]|uniref:Uncharacterized protein n=1 Tax=Euroglyphus maynei TaxID=6958 RepID=A0A1Y3B304_EURMA|nr:hypothetical protein BLA29_009815 [Euroglyphus maynei]